MRDPTSWFVRYTSGETPKAIERGGEARMAGRLPGYRKETVPAFLDQGGRYRNSGPMNPLTYVLILVIQFYRNYLVGENPPFECNYEPTCSEYTIRALEEHGLIEGIRLGWKRITSCTDSNKLEPTYDPVPNENIE